MRPGVALSIVGSGVLLALVGCGRIGFEQREPWRRDAELACLRAGAVKESVARVPIRSIEGPGICGADYPFKVSALGDKGVLGYRDEVRPPAAVPPGFPIPPPRAADYVSPSEPLSLHAPGTEAEEEDADPHQLDLPGSRPGAPAAAPAAPMTPRLGPAPGYSVTAGAASVSPAATLACPLVSRLDQWVASAVQPSAQRWFGQPVVEIKQISAYSCRGMNGNPRAHISEHAFGNALDVAAFVLADGRRVTVKSGWHGAPEEQGFLRDVQGAACQYFSTVLAPGSNRFHYDHIHVDLARRRSGRVVCNPRAVPGELIARRAQERLVTGSVGGRLSFAPEGADAHEPRLPRAIPGED